MTTVTWSISTEWFFYLCFPVVMMIDMRFAAHCRNRFLRCGILHRMVSVGS